MGRIISFTLGFMLAGMIGCAAIADHQATAKLTIQYATLKYIDGDQDKAQRVARIAAEAKGFVLAGASLDDVEAAVRARIPWDQLDDADKVLVNGLLDAIREELEFRVQHQLLDPDQVMAVSAVIAWVEEAARL